MPEYNGDIKGLGTTRLLEAIRGGGIKTRFYQTSRSEIFGNAPALTTFIAPEVLMQQPGSMPIGW